MRRLVKASSVTGIDCNGDIDVDGHTNLDNVSVAGIATFTNVVTKFGTVMVEIFNDNVKVLSTGTNDLEYFLMKRMISRISDYIFIGQQKNLDFVIKANPNAGNIDFQ